MKLFLGTYPGGYNLDATRATISDLLNRGFRLFIDLTEQNELAPYDTILAEEAEKRDLKVTYRRFAIPNGSVPSHPMFLVRALAAIEEGLAESHVYLHCAGNLKFGGRTGLVAGCWLQEDGWSTDQVFAELLRLWKKLGTSQPQSVRGKRLRAFRSGNLEATKVATVGKQQPQLTAWMMMRPVQIDWIHQWVKRRKDRTRWQEDLAMNGEVHAVFRRFSVALGSLRKEIKRLNEQIDRGEKVDPQSLKDLSRRFNTLKKETFFTLDMGCRVLGISLTNPRTTSDARFFDEIKLVPGFRDLRQKFHRLEAELSATEKTGSEKVKHRNSPLSRIRTVLSHVIVLVPLAAGLGTGVYNIIAAPSDQTAAPAANNQISGDLANALRDMGAADRVIADVLDAVGTCSDTDNSVPYLLQIALASSQEATNLDRVAANYVSAVEGVESAASELVNPPGLSNEATDLSDAVHSLVSLLGKDPFSRFRALAFPVCIPTVTTVQAPQIESAQQRLATAQQELASARSELTEIRGSIDKALAAFNATNNRLDVGLVEITGGFLLTVAVLRPIRNAIAARTRRNRPSVSI
jgi:hypothetical protein